MNIETWTAFLITAGLVSASPGPNMLHMLASGTRHGLRRTFFAMCGCFLAVFVLDAVSLAGLGVILATSPTAFNIVRYAGAAYLIYVGIRSFTSAAAISDSEIEFTKLKIGRKEIFLKGFLVGISNPKAILFAVAFFPQFIDIQKPQLPQFIILILTFAGLEFTSYTIYALGGTKLAKLLSNPGRQKLFNRIIGCLFMGFGILLLFYKLN